MDESWNPAIELYDLWVSTLKYVAVVKPVSSLTFAELPTLQKLRWLNFAYLVKEKFDG